MNREAHHDRTPIERALAPGEEPPFGAHLTSPRSIYRHHGIYVGRGRVIHYAGLARGLRPGPVEEVSLEGFAHGRPVCVRTDRATFDRAEVVRRARRRLGEAQYRLLTNNCEHFCQWCVSGNSRSEQVEGLRRLFSLKTAAIPLAQRRRLVQGPVM